MDTRKLHISAVLMVAMVLTACGAAGGEEPTSAARATSAPAGQAATQLAWSPPTIDPANFVSRVTNPYLPLVPGTTLHYRGVMKDGVTPQEDTFTVTHMRKVVMGV